VASVGSPQVQCGEAWDEDEQVNVEMAHAGTDLYDYLTIVSEGQLRLRDG
jgi:hypothetical protein